LVGMQQLIIEGNDKLKMRRSRHFAILHQI